MRALFQFIIILSCFSLLYSCSKEEKVPEPFKPKNDHEAYQYSLQQANLLSTALGADWQKSATNSLENPIKVAAPYQEAFYLAPNEATAVSYHFEAKRGQKIQVSFSAESAESTQLFVDLFRIDESEKFRHVASADKETLMLGFEPRADAAYVLRFQPELLRGGNFKVTIENVPTLQFPVAGKTARAIQSVWGDARDGGRRSHEGVDIFARRGTYVLAPTEGYVSFVGVRGIGGKVVWLKDQKRSQSLYFAHLDKLIAKQGTYVQPGDTLGTVGNTGNARTTPPHLHFGVYKNGAVNPFYYLQDPPAKVKAVGDEIALLGGYARLTRNTGMKTAPADRRPNNSLSRNELAKVVGMNSDSYRIQLANGKYGYVPRRYLTDTQRPLEVVSLAAGGDLLKSPDQQSVWQSLEAGEEVAILGRHADYWYVKNGSGETGWLSDMQKSARDSREIVPE
jgi:murein DD-endopeptidase MepM/ murein hydrolase activator NlpD